MGSLKDKQIMSHIALRALRWEIQKC